MKNKHLYIPALIIISLVLFISPSKAEDNQTANIIHLLKMEDIIINPIAVEYISKEIQFAKKQNALCIIIELDTPGGLLQSTREIVKEILNSPLPIVVYISPSGARAGSAGTFITASSHIAVMAPATNIGAAHPVDLMPAGKDIRNIFDTSKKKDMQLTNIKQDNESDKQLEDDKNNSTTKPSNIMEEKLLNDTIAWITALSNKRNRNTQWYKEAVLKSSSITDKEALDLNVIDFIAEDINTLVNKLDGYPVTIQGKEFNLHTEKAEIINISMTLTQKILNSIIHPNIAYIFMLLGFFGLLYEFTHPGIGVPGIAGLIFLVIGLYAFSTIPINYAGVVLILLGLILFIAEALTPTFGLLTLGGVISMFLGSLMLIRSPFPEFKLSIGVILATITTTSIITIFLVGLVVKTHRKKAITGKEGMIGMKANVVEDISPEKQGRVFVHGEIWNAKSSFNIKRDRQVEIININGLTLEVKPKD